MQTDWERGRPRPPPSASRRRHSTILRWITEKRVLFISPPVGGTPTGAIETIALVRLRMSVHGRVEVPLWRCFPPRVESNCVLATGRGEQLETKGQSVELTGQNGPRHKLDTALCD